ncbi:hypothetical protein BMS3Abin03_01623 [bacterium BMS3Abin03]|nr:hypothetical protein BMS3Abin03_01623 [bacterium BMS3Abin03]
MKNKIQHTFHVPVMGTGFTIDTPVRVAKYGISSVISIIDYMLMEKMRGFYCKKLNIPYEPITEKDEDFRAKRITAYLNLIDDIVKDNFNELINSFPEDRTEVEKYMAMLPDSSELKQDFNEMIKSNKNVNDIRNWLHNNLPVGSIDVNIMTKVDKTNYLNGEALPSEHNDAHASLRGFANSKLSSSIILSAGLNPRLYGYFEKFKDFFPDENGNLKKKIVLKVSDYRSAIIQGKYFAKKGLWVSEYRIESGLNCGGHAFASDGFLMGPILDEFRVNRETLIETIFEIYILALKNKNSVCPQKPLDVKITAQGGIGTFDEHQFILDYYKLDSIGWGTPFLLVPEVTNVDKHTREMLTQAKEKDLYLSKISPLGVPFNNLKGNTKDIEKMTLVDKGSPGSSCPKKFLLSSTEFTEKAICSASSRYQYLKLKELDSKGLSPEEHKKHFTKIVDKTCLCLGLGAAPLINNDIDRKVEGESVSICPGPNMAYYSEIISLKKMVDHIYGRTDIIKRNDRPNMFVKELSLYINFLKEKIDDSPKPVSEKELKYFLKFQKNIQDGIDYYKHLFSEIMVKNEEIKIDLLNNLTILERELNSIELKPAEEFTPQLLLVKAG